MSNNFLFKTKELKNKLRKHKKKENKTNPSFYCKVGKFSEKIQTIVIPKWLEEKSGLNKYKGIFTVDFTPFEDFE